MTIQSMTFTCNLSAQRCNLGLPLERSRNGDVIELQVDHPHENIAELVAGNLRSHIKSAGKQVAVIVVVRPSRLIEMERQAGSQRAAQRA